MFAYVCIIRAFGGAISLKSKNTPLLNACLVKQALPLGLLLLPVACCMRDGFRVKTALRDTLILLVYMSWVFLLFLQRLLEAFTCIGSFAVWLRTLFRSLAISYKRPSLYLLSLRTSIPALRSQPSNCTPANSIRPRMYVRTRTCRVLSRFFFLSRECGKWGRKKEKMEGSQPTRLGVLTHPQSLRKLSFIRKGGVTGWGQAFSLTFP